MLYFLIFYSYEHLKFHELSMKKFYKFGPCLIRMFYHLYPDNVYVNKI